MKRALGDGAQVTLVYLNIERFRLVLRHATSTRTRTRTNPNSNCMRPILGILIQYKHARGQEVAGGKPR